MSELDRAVLARIEHQGLKPRPAIYFLGLRSVYWSLAALSIMLGGLSVAVAIFAVNDFSHTGGRGLDEMPFDDVATSLPALWLMSIGLFALSAAFGVSRTRRGYRYRPLRVAALAVVASIALGIALHGFDLGRLTHAFLAAHFPAYERYTYIPYAEWSLPGDGYLGGEVLSVDGQTMRLKDFRGEEWSIDMSSAKITADQPLIEEDVAITGRMTGPHQFKAVSIAEFD